MATDMPTLAAKITALVTDLDSLTQTTSSVELLKHRAQLHRLRQKLEDCASFVPTPLPPTSYFELLSPEEAGAVVRHISVRPRHPKWMHFISPIDAGELFTLSGKLAMALAQSTDNISIGSAEKRMPNLFFHPYRKQEQKRHLRVEMKHCSAALLATQNHISRVRAAQFTAVPGTPMNESWVDAFCTSHHIRHLELATISAPAVERMLIACGGRLESITLDSYCSSTPYLRHVTAHCTQLSKISHYLRASHSESLWRAIGPKLTDVELHCASYYLGDDFEGLIAGAENATAAMRRLLTDVRVHCTSLTSVCVESHGTSEELISLLESCGMRLRYARLSFDCISSTRASVLAHACPNAVFESEGFMTPRIVRALGFRVRNLRMTDVAVDFLAISGIEVLSATDFCSKLVHLRTLELIRIRYVAVSMLESILMLSNPPLEELTVVVGNEPPFNVLDTLREAKVQLKFLSILAQELPSDGLAAFFDTQHRLETIILRTQVTRENRDLLPQLIHQCTRVSTLRKLRIEQHCSALINIGPIEPVVSSTEVSKLRNLCMPFRRRNVSVSIFGVDYLR